MTTKNLPLDAKSIKICSVEGCTFRPKAQSLCNKHYQRFRNHGDPNHELVREPSNRRCSMPECDKTHQAQGLCHTHYTRLKRHGDPNHTEYRTGCEIEGCQGKHAGLGYCGKHYQRLINHGDPLHVDMIVGDDEARFWSYVQKTDGCWLWTGYKLHAYGAITIAHTPVLAHRYSFFLHNGYWPKPMCLHSCDNPPCVNPKHLREGTHDDNMADRADRDRTTKGSGVTLAKLTETDVQDIRRSLNSGERRINLVRKYKVHSSTIDSIRKGRTWKHVQEEEII